MTNQYAPTQTRQAALQRTAESPAGQLFLKARALEAEGKYDQAFATFAEGNAMRANDPLDPVPPARFVDAQSDAVKIMKSVFVKDSIRKLREDAPRFSPIFLVGMPASRAGLIERTIAAHPSIQPLGENNALPSVANGRFPLNSLALVRPGQFARLRHDYQATLKNMGWNGTGRFTDRTLWNYLVVGTIALMYPRAVIIDVRRDVMENCLECYFSDFVQGQSFSYDLKEVGDEYSRYRELMEHWKSVFPHRVTEVSQEALAANPEAEVKKLITETCRLSWDEACLETYKANVPPPPVAHWTDYAAHLKPLLKALGPLSASR